MAYNTEVNNLAIRFAQLRNVRNGLRRDNDALYESVTAEMADIRDKINEIFPFHEHKAKPSVVDIDIDIGFNDEDDDDFGL